MGWLVLWNQHVDVVLFLLFEEFSQNFADFLVDHLIIVHLKFFQQVYQTVLLCKQAVWILTLWCELFSVIQYVGQAFQSNENYARFCEFESNTERLDNVASDHLFHQLGVAASSCIRDCPDRLLPNIWFVMQHQVNQFVEKTARNTKFNLLHVSSSDVWDWPNDFFPYSLLGVLDNSVHNVEQSTFNSNLSLFIWTSQ